MVLRVYNAIMTNQIKLLRKVSGQKRLETAFRLSATVRELAVAGIKAQKPNATKKDILNLWVKEISLPY